MIVRLLLFLLIPTVLIAEPKLTLYSPNTNFSSHKPLLLLKGVVEDAVECRINGHPVDLFNGRFYLKAQLFPYQVNDFVIEAIDDKGLVTTMKRQISYFPEEKISIDPYITVDEKKFDYEKVQWVIRGHSHRAETLYINSTRIPILNDGYFEYRFNFSPETAEEPSVQITGINDYTHLFSYRLGLSKSIRYVEQYSEDFYEPIQSLPYNTNTASFKKYERVISRHYEGQGWKRLMFTKNQESLMNQLIDAENNDLSAHDFVLFKRDLHHVLIAPYLDQSIDVEHLSAQLVSLLADSNDTLMTVLWYNTVPNFLELVFTNTLSGRAGYWVLDDQIMDATLAKDEKFLDAFRHYSFNQVVSH